MRRMALYVVLHHQQDESQPWVNAWLDDQLIEAIQTTSEIGALCRRAKNRGERVFVHRCGWGDCLPVIACSAEVEDVGRIDNSTALVRFKGPVAVGAEPAVAPVKGQNFYER
jgi:hypothetical protein